MCAKCLFLILPIEHSIHHFSDFSFSMFSWVLNSLGRIVRLDSPISIKEFAIQPISIVMAPWKGESLSQELVVTTKLKSIERST